MDEPRQRDGVPDTPADAETAIGNVSEPTLGFDAQPTFVYSPPPVVLSSRYDILGELGKGGMGVVYKARDRETGDLLALKVLRPEIAAREEFAERFVSELRLARQITHKNVCRIYDYNRVGDVSCISMELVEGESLRQVLERFGNLSVRTAMRMATQICAALREAHAQGIVHRDMKPENVMLDRRGDVKVMDFGIARTMTTGGEEQGISGTPAYMSPEQAQGKPTDARTDVYAIGMILYEMLSGKLPFEGKTTLEMARRGEPVSPKPLRELESTVPGHLERVALRCLEHDPERRYQSVADLETALRSETASEMEAFDLAAPEKLQRAHWFDGVLLLVAVAGVLALWLSRDTIAPESHDTLQVEAITARREAERVTKEFGYTNPHATPKLQYRAADYRRRVYDALEPFHSSAGRAMGLPLETGKRLRLVQLPLFWRVEFGGPRLDAVGQADGYVLVNREGRAIQYFRQVNPGFGFLPQYKPPSAEERRQIAKTTAEKFCGIALNEPPRTELAGGDSSASYTATWKSPDPDSLPTARVVLWTEVPYEVSCSASFERSSSDIEDVARSFTAFGLLVITAMLAGLLFRFAVGRLQESPLIARRAPVALLLGASTAWTAQVEWLGHVPSIPLTVIASLLASLMWLTAIATIEHRLLRFAPEKLAAWSALLRGRVFAPEVGLGVVRGTCLGLGIVGVQVGFAYWTVAERGKVVLGVPDPSAAANAIVTTVPALYTLAAVLTSTFVFGFVTAGLTMIVGARTRQRKQRVRLPYKIFGGLFIGYFALGFSAPLMYTLHLAFGQTLSGIILSIVPGIMLALVCFGIWRYDLLTSTVAAVTATLFMMNSMVLWLLEDLGNATQIGLFVAWGAILVAAVFVAFRPQVVQGLQTFKASMG